MTRVFQAPVAGGAGLRVVVVGAGAYPHAKGQAPRVPILSDLTSVAPGVMQFVRRLLVDWRESLADRLLSVELLLSDPAQPGGAVWPGAAIDGVPLAGAAEAGLAIAAPTIPMLDAALSDALRDATRDDTLMVLFCGHGFSSVENFFLLSDFGQSPNNPWRDVVNLSQLATGLQQVPARKQWLFWDCCSDILEEALNAMGGNMGDAVVKPDAGALAAINRANGPSSLSQFGMKSATLGAQAFGVAAKPSRFVEMLIEAIDGAGAIRPERGEWWVDDRGLVEAIKTYAVRHPDLDQAFYTVVTPYWKEAAELMRLRKVAAAPTSLLIARSAPRPRALKEARVVITPDGGGPVAFDQPPPQARAALYVPLPARRIYHVTAVPGGGALDDAGAVTKQTFTDLPLAEEVEFQLP